MTNWVIHLFSLSITSNYYFAYPQYVTNNNLVLTTCVSSLLKHLFADDSTINLIFDEHEDINQFLFQMDTPRIIVNTKNPISLSSRFYNSYVIYTAEHESLNKILHNLENSTNVWDKSESPRSKYLIIASSSNDIQQLFAILWGMDIINALIVTYGNGSPEVYTADPFSQENKCVRPFNISYYKQHCNKSFSYQYPEFPRKLDNCILKLTDHYETLEEAFAESTNTGVLMFILTFISTNFNAGIRSIRGENDVMQLHYNRSDDIVLSSQIQRAEELLVYYDLSSMYFQDKSIFVVPRRRVFAISMTLIYDLKVWWMIIIVFLAIVVSWWLFAKCRKEELAFKKFSRCFISVLVLTLSSADNVKPKISGVKIFFNV